MTIRTVKKPNVELIDFSEDIDINDYVEKYIFWVDGYSILSNIGFIKFELGLGNNLNDTLFYAYNKIKNNLSINYNITVNEMKISDYKLYNETNNPQPSGFIFHPLTEDIIEEFKEDEERYFMSCNDK